MSLTSSRIVRATALAALVPLALAACGSDTTTTTTPAGTAGGAGTAGAAGPTLVNAGKLTACTHLSYKPFEFKDDSGATVGFDVDLADFAAKKLGVTTEIVDIDFASITSGAVFAAGKCDIGFGATTINDTRKEAVLFSTPYFSATQALLAKADAGVTDLASLKGKKLGVQTDTTGQEYAEENKEANGYEVVVFDDLPTSLTGVQSGAVDAVINDNGPLLDFTKDTPGFAVAKEFDTGEQYGFMARKDDANGTAIMNVFNEALAESLKDGSYVESYKKWFGSEPQVLPTAG